MHRQEYAEVRKWEETQWLWISSQWHPGLCLENAAFPSLLSVGRLTEQCHSHKKCPQPLNLFATISQFLDKECVLETNVLETFMHQLISSTFCLLSFPLDERDSGYNS